MRLRLYRSVLLLLFFSNSFVSADPIQINSIDASRYPLVKLSVKGDVQNSSELIIEEIVNENRIPVKLESVASSNPESILNASRTVILVMDATKSVPVKDFAASVRSANRIVKMAQANDQFAIFRINGEPIQVLEKTSDHSAVRESLESMKRDGKVTRIYDTIYAALQYAKKQGSRSGPVEIVVFTDGRDEGSYITEEDVVRLARNADEFQVPLYFVLSGKKKNFRHFKRLALLSGGAIFLKGIPEVREVKKQTVRIQNTTVEYYSQIPIYNQWPGRNIDLSVERNLLGDQKKYTIPFNPVKAAEFNLAQALTLGVCLLFLILLAIVLMIAMKPKKSQITELKEENHDSEPVDLHQTVVQEQAREAEQADSFLERAAQRSMVKEFEETKPEPPGKPEVYGDAPSFDEYNSWNDLEDPEDVARRSGIELRDDEPVRMKNQRRRSSEVVALQVKERSYQLIQQAMKEAGRYESAALTLGDRHYDLYMTETYLGRSPVSNLPVYDRAASPVHVRIRRMENKYILFDLLSDAGVFLNGKKVLRPRGLKDGDEVLIGSTSYLFRGYGML